MPPRNTSDRTHLFNSQQISLWHHDKNFWRQLYVRYAMKTYSYIFTTLWFLDFSFFKRVVYWAKTFVESFDLGYAMEINEKWKLDYDMTKHPNGCRPVTFGSGDNFLVSTRGTFLLPAPSNSLIPNRIHLRFHSTKIATINVYEKMQPDSRLNFRRIAEGVPFRK